MRSFSAVVAVAAPLPLANVDTDKILPARFLKTISRDGLGGKLFWSLRYGDDESERTDFILNRPPWRSAGILITLENFGCGSSREHAPWSLLDFGIRCIIAPSFADIFYNNCFKNGILPIILARAVIDVLLEDACEPSSATLRVDLPTQTITRADGEVIPFDVEPERKRSLLLGLDEVGASLLRADEISRWEAKTTVVAPPITHEKLQD